MDVIEVVERVYPIAAAVINLEVYIRREVVVLDAGEIGSLKLVSLSLLVTPCML